MLDVSVIVVNYNTKEFLKKCISSIVENVKGVAYEIIVVDNASSDDSAESIKYYVSSIKYRNIRIIANKENLGFARANNQGIKISKDGKYILFLNPDTVVQKDAIEKMIEFMDQHQDAAAATCKLVMPNGEIDDAIHRGFPTPWNSFCHFSGLAKIFPKSKLFSGYNLGFLDLNTTHEIDALAGAFMIVRRKAGKDVGWWDEDYFFYGEDIEFCYQLKKRGWKIYYVPTVSILHHKGVSGGIKKVSKEITTASKETKKRATKWRFEAMRIFYNKHYKQKYPRFVNFLVNIGISIKEHI